MNAIKNPHGIDEEVLKLATFYYEAGMNPFGMDRPQKLALAIIHGKEVGLPPAAAIQSIMVTNGRPVLFGDGLLAVCRASPLCEWITEWIEGEGEKMVAYCETLRRGEPNPVRRSFSVFDAQRAGLWQTEAKIERRTREGKTYPANNDSPWWRYPKRMLQMRARGWCLRDTYADILKGIQLGEEVQDMERLQLIDSEAEAAHPARLSAAATKAIEKQHDGVAFDLGKVTETVEEMVAQRDPEPEAAEVAPEPETAPEPAPEASKAVPGDEIPEPLPLLPLDEQLDWLRNLTIALVSAAHEGEIEVFTTAWEGVKRDFKPDRISPEIRAKVKKIYGWCFDIVDPARDSAENVEASLMKIAATADMNIITLKELRNVN